MKRTGDFEVIIPACGVGKRMGISMPKQFYLIDNKPVLIHTLRRFSRIKGLYGIIIVCSREYKKHIEDLIKKNQIGYVKKVVIGGRRRQDSIKNALRYLELKKIVVIHDAVRPCVKESVIKRGILYAKKYGAACAAVPAEQTLAYVKGGFIKKNVSRDDYWYLQTPQVFQYDGLIKSFKKAYKNRFEATDDTQIVSRYSGKKVKIYKGNEENIKITYKKDLEIVATLLKKFYD
jgi:2-C-methyl-D-erythritol 4-phosphate cytidylyltransferase